MSAMAEPSVATRAPADDAGEALAVRPSVRQWRPSWVFAVTLAAGLAVTAALSLTALSVYHRNETRLLNLRVRELNLVLAATAPAIQTPLASAAELANATQGDVKKFRAFVTPFVGPKQQFQSISLWRLGGKIPQPVVVLGYKPLLAAQPAQAAAFFSPKMKTGVMNVTSILPGKPPALGFGYSIPSARRSFAVYAENPLPSNRRSRIEGNTAFSDLNYAVYLGRSRRASDVIVTSVDHLPLKGRTAADTVPFGAGAFTLVVSPRGSLGGSFFQSLPWIIALLGCAVSLAAALMTDRLAQRRRRAEVMAGELDQIAAETRERYTEQRSISQTLQHALLPDTLPEFNGLQVTARYVPAASGVDIGGDWYDVVATDEQRVLLVIGDVSGHGLRAATTMAMLRHTALAYVAQDARPASVLTKLSDFVNRGSHDYFATVLCVLIDVAAHEVTVASAGHMAPLLLGGERAEFIDLDVDAPIGVPGNGGYRETTVAVPPNATLLAFTDGLVERRGEVLDVGLARLRDLATRERLGLDDLIARLARELATDDHHDDTAIVGIRWQN
jgi:serine phosphatase RsbU (regulator of sigma subunit)